MSVIAPDQRHSLCAAAPDSGLEVLVMQFDAQRALAGLDPADEFGRAWLQGELFFPAALQPPPSAVQDLLCIGQELEQELPCCETMVRASLLRLLVYLWRQRPQREILRRRPDDEEFAPAPLSPGDFVHGAGPWPVCLRRKRHTAR